LKDKTADYCPASIAAVGMALTIYPIGVERGMMTRHHAVQLTLAALRFFAASEQGTGVDLTRYQSIYYHFLEMEAGKRVWDCELSRIDTDLLMAGVLVARDYFNAVPARQLGMVAGRLEPDLPWLEAGIRLFAVALGRL
jgi:hypothetical protein